MYQTVKSILISYTVRDTLHQDPQLFLRSKKKKEKREQNKYSSKSSTALSIYNKDRLNRRTSLTFSIRLREYWVADLYKIRSRFHDMPSSQREIRGVGNSRTFLYHCISLSASSSYRKENASGKGSFV